MGIARSAAAGIRLGCLLVVVGAGCGVDPPVGGRDAGLVDRGPDAGDASTAPDGGTTDASRDGGSRDAALEAGRDAALEAGADAGRDASRDASSDSGARFDSGVPDPVPDGAIAYVRFSHLAFGVGDVHLCVRQRSVASGAEVRHVLLTARDAAPGASHAWTPLALVYPAITSGDTMVPLSVIDSTDAIASTAEAWRASDLDTSAAAIGSDALARCVPRSGAAPFATRVLAAAADGGLGVGGHYTLMATGRPSASATDCLASDGTTAVACPSGALQILDDMVDFPTSGTAVRIVNASTRFASQGACAATISDPVNGSTGPSVAIVPPGGVPVLLPRVASTPTSDFHSDFVVGPNLTPGSVQGSPTALLVGLALRSSPSASCPSKLFAPPPAGSGVPDPRLGQAYAIGGIPQSLSIMATYNGVEFEAQSVGMTGTSDGDAVTVFLVDADTTGTGAASGILPIAILIVE